MGTNEIVPMRFVGRSRLGFSFLAKAMLAVGLTVSSPVHANTGMSGAEKLYRLNVMLQAVGQTCRATPDNFAAEYTSFRNSHVADLTQTAAEFRAELAARYGSAGAEFVLDRMNASMANNYADGHPWLDCAQLKMATRNLGAVIGRETLEEAADQLIGDSRPTRFADARR